MHPSQLDPGNHPPEMVIDGAVRLQAMAGFAGHCAAWSRGAFPHLVFPLSYREGIYSLDNNKLLPRMLVLAGHYDRAWEFIPDVWRGSPREVCSFLNVPMVDAACVYAVRKRLREPRRIVPRGDVHSRTIERIRAGLAELDETGSGFGLDDVRRLVAQ
jgi:hypothetical protein